MNFIQNFYFLFFIICCQRGQIKNKGYNFINTKGELLSPNLWFDDVFSFYDGFARVEIENRGWNFINTKGEILSPDLWFDDTYSFYSGFAKVQIKNKGYYFINTKGELYHEDKKTKLTPEEIEELKQIQSQVSESSRIKQIINNYLIENMK